MLKTKFDLIKGNARGLENVKQFHQPVDDKGVKIGHPTTGIDRVENAAIRKRGVIRVGSTKQSELGPWDYMRQQVKGMRK